LEIILGVQVPFPRDFLLTPSTQVKGSKFCRTAEAAPKIDS